MRQHQHHEPHRAPHGKPEKTERLAARVTPEQLRKFRRRGGSAWLRGLIQSAP